MELEKKNRPTLFAIDVKCESFIPMLYGPTNTGSYVKVTGIVVDLGVHDAPDLHLGLHWQSRLSFQEKQVRFCGKSNKKKDFIQVKPWKQISKCIPNPTIPSSFPLLHIYSIFVFSNFFQNQQAFYFRKHLAVSFRKPLSLNLALSDCELRRRPLSVTTQRDSTLSQRSSNSSSQGSSTVATWGKAMTFGEPPLLRVVGVATLVMDTWLFNKCLKGKGGSGIALEMREIWRHEVFFWRFF